MKTLIKIIKKITFSIVLIYSYNILVSSFNLNVAVNTYSVAAVSAMGVPGLISLIVLKLLIK